MPGRRRRDRGADRASHASQRGSVGRWLVEDHGQADDLAVPDAEVAGHDQLVGQACLPVRPGETTLAGAPPREGQQRAAALTLPLGEVPRLGR